MTTHRIAVIPGDGIGNEVMPEGIRAMEAAGRKFGFRFDWVEFPWGCEHYTKTGRMMPEDGLDQLRPFEAIYFGAVGFPGVPDHVSLWGLLIPMRRGFRQYANIRPVRLFPGLRSPLGEPRARRHRLRRGAREQRGRVFLGRRSHVRRHRRRGRRAAEHLHPKRRRPHPALRVRACPRPPEEAPDLRHQVERHRHHHAVLGRTLRRHGEELPRRAHRSVPHRHPVRPFRPAPGLVRRGGGIESLRRHPFGPRPGDHGHHRHRAVGEPQSRAGISRPSSSPCTAPRPTSSAATSPTRSDRSGRAR